MECSSFQSLTWYQAATLTERVAELNTGPDRPDVNVDMDLAQRRMQRWRSQAPFAAGSCFAQRLATDGLDEDELLYCLGEPAEVLNSRLANSQGWLEQFLGAFSRPASSVPLPLPETLRGLETTGFLNLIEPLLRAALDRVQGEAQKLADLSSDPPFDPVTASALLFASLPGKVLAMLSRTLVLELHVARLEGLLDGVTAEERFHSFVERLRRSEVALDLLQEYPVLARQLAVCIDHWVNFGLEFLQHLNTDWELIRATFAPRDEPGTLVGVIGDVGDSHRSGRSVLIAKFSSGLEVVYKPRSLSVDMHFQQLLVWLNERGDHPPFRTLKILDRGNHGWVEFIAARACSSAAEVRRFYEREGAYLALLYALEATDFHFENLIAAGEHPILLDLEALFHPRVESLGLRQMGQSADNTISYSVLRVGLLPQRTGWGKESAGVDISGVGSPPGQLTARSVPRWEGAGTDEMRLTRKRVEIPGGQNRPTLHGAEISVLDYADAIVAGFTSLYRSLLKHRDDLLSDEGPLARFAEDEVRVLLRATPTYGLLLGESFHPDVLRNGLDRDRLFDRLWVPFEDCPYLAKVIPSERHDLQSGDIPLFTTRPNSRDLWSSSHERIADFFHEPGMAFVRRSIQRLSDQDWAQQLWFIRASLATLSNAGEGARRPAYPLAEPTAPADRERLLSAARRVGNRLDELALKGDQDISWIGLTLANQRDWILGPLGYDLYDGLTGVALFLAYLGEIGGETHYTTLAKTALGSLRRLVENSESSIVQIGGFDGWGGVIYVLTHLSILWDQPHLLTEAEAMVERLPALIQQDEQFDVLSGAAGCIGSLLALYRCAPSRGTLAALVQCGDHLLAHARPMPRGIGWLPKGVASKPLTGFAHGAAGIAWALLELAVATGEQRFRDAALAAIEYERGLFSAAEGNWPDLRDWVVSGQADKGRSWCHGAAGIGLSRLACLPHLNDPQIRSEIDAALRSTLGQGFGNNHCLCHGDLGNLELLLQASLTLGQSRWQGDVSRMSAIILESIDQNGFVCGNPLGVQSPGLMSGLAGVGYELLRLAEPGRVPSVLALAPPSVPTDERQLERDVAVVATAQ